MERMLCGEIVRYISSNSCFFFFNYSGKYNAGIITAKSPEVSVFTDISERVFAFFTTCIAV